MKRFMVMAAVVVMLAAGGAARAAEKEAPIDWPARAATVKVGMTRAEVEKILPRWTPPSRLVKQSVIRDGKHTLVLDGPNNYSGDVILINGHSLTSMPGGYLVAEDWRVKVCYDFTGSVVPPLSFSNGVMQINDGWENPQNRLVAPVKIEKVEKPVSPKPTP